MSGVARKLSVAMIVRDEEKTLAQCLESVAEVADEFCIVDTGSRDATLDIARQHGARTAIHIWSDDFAAARNESLRMCTGDWVMVLDADERIDTGDLKRLRALADGPKDVCYRFRTRNYTNTTSVSEFHRCAPGDPHARGFAGWYPSHKVRLFPNIPEARFEGRVHELVHQSLERAGVRAVDTDIPVHHYPYLKGADEMRAKQERYLRLGHAKVQERPDDPQGYIELGAQYAEVGDFERATAAFREALRRDPHRPDVLKDLGTALFALGRTGEALKVLRLALELDPNQVEAWRNLGAIHVGGKSWDTAVECLERAVGLDPGDSENHRYLAIALEGDDHLTKAAAHARRAVELDPASAQAIDLFMHQMLRLERRDQAREQVERLVREGNEHVPLLTALGDLCFYEGLLEQAAHHYRRAAEQGSADAWAKLGVVFFRRKDLSAAREAFSRCLAIDPEHAGARENLGKLEARQDT